MTQDTMHCAKDLLLLMAFMSLYGPLFCTVLEGPKWAKFWVVLIFNLLMFMSVYPTFLRLLR